MLFEKSGTHHRHLGLPRQHLIGRIREAYPPFTNYLVTSRDWVEATVLAYNGLDEKKSSFTRNNYSY